MTEQSLETVVLSSEKFRRTLTVLSTQSITDELPAVVGLDSPDDVDWAFALMCASALTSAPEQVGQEAALRVAHACLTGQDDDALREAAALILERLGNREALALAARRGLVGVDSWRDAPAPMQQDVIRRRLELTIPTKHGDPVRANAFQRAFWTQASRADWLSVSAPTSAGKSFIVKRWLIERATARDEFRAVYVVPTRALIEEVSLDLMADLGSSVKVHTMPWDAEIGRSPKEMFVLTQERFHLLQQRLPDFEASIVFVDEAQKVDDGARGILLQQVIDEAVRRSPGAQVIFASPMTSNPEILLAGAPAAARTEAFTSQSVTVSQNLLWANQRRGRPQTWDISLVVDGEPIPCGEFQLLARPAPASKRLPLVAASLGQLRSGNVVYVNGAADAEKVAKQIYEALGTDADLGEDPDILALRELATTAVHPRYGLDEVLRRGVAFHYGNMPLLLKSEIERLFKEEKLRYLVCTSTLLEGVNLPCRNLFVRGPRKGRGNVMTPGDFWNLAGRAGRWGKEFQGNIVCVDTSDPAQWPSPPLSRARLPISRATDRVIADASGFKSFLEGIPQEAQGAGPLYAPFFSLLASRVIAGRSLDSIVGLDFVAGSEEALTAAVTTALESVSFPSELVERHAGISPLAMQALFDSFEVEPSPEDLVLPLPESQDAASSYVRAIARVHEHLGGDWGPPGRQYQLAILITQWMRGLPLAQLVSGRIAYYVPRGESLPAVIRSTLTDVEQIARFQAPKYLACYQDLLKAHLIAIGSDALAETGFDLSMMLELGVSRATEVALMALGLSRTTTVALSALIMDDNLEPSGALAWLREQDVEALPLPALVVREIRTRLQASEAIR